jgi:cholesterol transport system auxiliary component
MTMTSHTMRPGLARRTLLRGSVLLPLAGALGACQLGGGAAPAPRQFQLKAPVDFPDELPVVAWSLVVERPDTARPLDTTRIAHFADSTELQYYAGADWADRAPDMVHNLMLEAFRNSGKVEALAGDRTSLRPDFVLRSALREFQAEKSGDDPTSVYVLMTVSLLQMPRRDTVGTTDIGDLHVIEGGGIEGIVAGFDRAVGTVLRDIVVWTLQTGQAAAVTS